MIQICKTQEKYVKNWDCLYATEKQLEITMNKQKFKELCREYDIPVVPEIKIENDINSEDFK